MAAQFARGFFVAHGCLWGIRRSWCCLLVLGALVQAVALAPALAQRNLTVAATQGQPAHEPRTALVIGNADYPDAPLANPVNDARAVAERLTALGFRVMRLENATQEQMYEAIRGFGDSLQAGGGVGLFYYAGHALQVRGRNHLLPVRARIEREDEILYRTVDVGQVLDKMDSARNRVNIVILDACRNNPFGRSFRSVVPGLAVMDAPHNTLIAFATAPGAVASDGAGQHGLYTQHLLQALNRPGLSLEDVFKQVRTGVRQDSAGRQVPWENTSLEVAFSFDPPRPPMAATPAAPAATSAAAGAANAASGSAGAAGAAPMAMAPLRPDPLTVELAFWDSIKGSSDPEDYRAYLQRYPDGQFAVLARNRLRGQGGQTVAPPAATAPPMTAPVPAAAVPPAASAPRPPAPASLPTTPSPAPAPVTPPPVRPAASSVPPPAAVSPIVPVVTPPSRPEAAGPTAGPTAAPAGGLHVLAGRMLAGAASGARAVAVTRSGAQLFIGEASGPVRLWAPGGAQPLRGFIGHGGAVTALAASPDGQHLLSGSADRSLRWWSIATGTELARLNGHVGAVTAALVAPTGRYALSSADDGELVSWSLPDGRLLQRVRAGDRPISALGLSPDGRWVLSGDDQGLVRWWDVGGLRSLRPLGQAAGAIVALAIDARRAAAVDNTGRVWRWRLPEGEPLGGAVTGLAAPVRAAWSADGAWLLLAGADGRAQLWQITDDRPVPRAELSAGAGAANTAAGPGAPGGAAAVALGSVLPGAGGLAVVAGGDGPPWWWRMNPEP